MDNQQIRQDLDPVVEQLDLLVNKYLASLSSGEISTKDRQAASLSGLTLQQLTDLSQERFKKRELVQPRRWSSRFADDLDESLLLLFDVAQAAGAAADNRYLMQQLRRCFVDKAAADKAQGAETPEDFKLESLHYQLCCRLRTHTLRVEKGLDRFRWGVGFSMFGEALRRADATRMKSPDVYDILKREAKLLPSDDSDRALTHQEIEDYVKQQLPLLLGESKEVGVCVSLFVFNRLFEALMAGSAPEIEFKNLADLCCRSDAQRERLQRLLGYSPRLKGRDPVTGKLSHEVLPTLQVATRVWRFLSARDLSYAINEGNGALLLSDDFSFRRWVSCTRFDKAKHQTEEEKQKRISPQPGIFETQHQRKYAFEKRGLVFGGKRWIDPSLAADQLNEAAQTAITLAEQAFGVILLEDKTSSGRQKNSLTKTNRLLNAFDTRTSTLPGLITAEVALAIESDYLKEARRDRREQVYNCTDELPARVKGDESKATLYELVRAGRWKASAVTGSDESLPEAPFDLTAEEAELKLEDWRKLYVERQLPGSQVKATTAPIDPYTEMDIFAALRAGMEFSAIQALLKGAYLLNRIQLSPDKKKARILLNTKQVEQQVRPPSHEADPATVHYHHHLVKQLQLHADKTIITARESNDTDLHHRFEWVPLREYRLPLLKESEPFVALEMRFLSDTFDDERTCEFATDEEITTAYEKSLKPTPQECQLSPVYRFYQDKLSRLAQVEWRGKDWAGRTAEQFLDLLGLSFKEVAAEPMRYLEFNDPLNGDEIKALENLKECAVARQRRKPPKPIKETFRKIRDAFIRYFWAYQSQHIALITQPLLVKNDYEYSEVPCYYPREEEWELLQDWEIQDCIDAGKGPLDEKERWERDIKNFIKEDESRLSPELGDLLSKGFKNLLDERDEAQKLCKAKSYYEINIDGWEEDVEEDEEDKGEEYRRVSRTVTVSAEVDQKLISDKEAISRRRRMSFFDQELRSDGLGWLSLGLEAEKRIAGLKLETFNYLPLEGEDEDFKTDFCLPLMLFAPSSDHRKELNLVFGEPKPKKETEGEDKPEAEAKSESEPEPEMRIPVPVFHYSRAALLRRGWSESMIRRLLIENNYRLLKVENGIAIPARWVWDAEEGWAKKLLGARKRSRGAKRSATKSNATARKKSYVAKFSKR